MGWFDKLLPPKIKQTNKKRHKSIAESLWVRCSSCHAVLRRSEVKSNQNVCLKCNYQMKINARDRLDALLDREYRYEIGQEVIPIDILKFKDSKKYTDRLKKAMEDSKESDAIVVIGGKIHGLSVVAACFEFSFIGGSMGSVVGERFVRGVQKAIEHEAPFICFTASGGARLQENLFSLMQMAKTAAVLTKLSEARLPFISILTNPTMGGVSASFAFLGDIVIAEPKALIGFTGPHLIEQTVREKLPIGFQHSEFLLKTGAIDIIVERRKLRDKIAQLIAILQKKHSLTALR
ncbi:MAG: acetyl-CoA carboxylase, carboxyltransferase subunit beta [Burkholderia sp.]|nr:acetyl-CoA carboxylase, carboxyltransferase subunit beta [Burkholderia sp.]